MVERLFNRNRRKVGRLVERDFMSAADLVAVAARVEETNPYLAGITERLRNLLDL